MRDIKFRQPIRNKQGKFIEWFYWGCIDGEWIQWATQQNGLDTRKESQQFTGFEDKNGRQIYEGDIFPSNSEGIKFYKLVFENGGFVLYHNYGHWGTIARFIEASKKFNFNLDIVGNIYENPDYLTNKK